LNLSSAATAMALLVAITGCTTVRAATAPPQQVDRRVFEVVTGASAGSHSVYVRVADQLPGVADRSARLTVHKLTDSLYLRVIPESHTKVGRGAFAYLFQLARDAAGREPIGATDQPSHGPSADLVRAADFRNSDNTGPNALGPKNVNAAGEVRTIAYGELVMEIRVLGFAIVGLGPSQIPAFSELSCVVTVRAARHLPA
jgi:hypothetical protein